MRRCRITLLGICHLKLTGEKVNIVPIGTFVEIIFCIIVPGEVYLTTEHRDKVGHDVICHDANGKPMGQCSDSWWRISETGPFVLEVSIEMFIFNILNLTVIWLCVNIQQHNSGTRVKGCCTKIENETISVC